MLAPRALVRLLDGQRAQDPSPNLDLKVPGMQAGCVGENIKGTVRTKKPNPCFAVACLKDGRLSRLSQNQNRSSEVPVKLRIYGENEIW